MAGGSSRSVRVRGIFPTGRDCAKNHLRLRSTFLLLKYPHRQACRYPNRVELRRGADPAGVKDNSFPKFLRCSAPPRIVYGPVTEHDFAMTSRQVANDLRSAPERQGGAAASRRRPRFAV